MGSVVFEVFTLKTMSYQGFVKEPGSSKGSKKNAWPAHLSPRYNLLLTYPYQWHTGKEVPRYKLQKVSDTESYSAFKQCHNYEQT